MRLCAEYFLFAAVPMVQGGCPTAGRGPLCRADGAKRGETLPGMRRIVFTQAVKLPLLSGLCRNAQAPEQEAVGKEIQGACVEKVSPQSPGKSGPFSPCGRGRRVLIPFPPEMAFTFSTT